MALHIDTIPTPIRSATVAIDDDGAIVRFAFTTSIDIVLAQARDAGDDAIVAPGCAAHVAEQLAAWFAGERRDFDLPVAPRGTAFQRRVWAALQQIPFGTVCTYGALAEAIGRPTAARAVGQANGRNPIALILPCHRVVGAHGLGGYTGGLAIKRALLEHEGTLHPAWIH